MDPRTVLATVVVLAILLIAAVAFAPRATQAYAAGGIAVVVVGALAALAVARATRADPSATTGGDEKADAEDAAADERAVAVPDMSEFEQVAATRFSTPRPDHARQEICFFRRLDPDRKFKRVIDATAHVGIDTHVLAEAYGCKVDAVEYVEETYKALAKNVAKFGRPGVTAVRASAVDYLKTAGEADLVYMDPPWGGPGYKRVDDLPLYDADGKQTIPLGPVVDSALEAAPVVVLKVPHNFNYPSFERKIKGHIVNVARVKYRSSQYKRKRAVFVLLEIRKDPVSCDRAA